MSEINSISSALHAIQSRTQQEISIAVLKQAAQAERAMAEMLAANVENARNMGGGKGMIDVYV